MVRRSPTKNKKKVQTTQPGIGSVPMASLESTLAPRLDPQDEGSNEPWSPTRSKLSSPTKPLSRQMSSLQQERDVIDNKLWDATVELQERVRQKELDDEQIERIQAELNRLRSEYEIRSQDLDSLKGKESELESALLAAQEQAMLDKKSSLEKLEARDEYIDRLQGQIDSLRSEMNSLQALSANDLEKPSAPQKDAMKTGDTSLSWSFDTTADHSFSGSTVPQTPGSNDLLTSLGRQKRQHKSLRNLLNKQRLENFELRKQLAELNGMPVPTMGSGGGSDEEDDEDDDDSILAGTYTGENVSSPQIEAIPQNIDGGFALSEDLAPTDLQHDMTVATSLQSQARAINHALVPMAEFEQLSNQASAHAEPIGSDELKRLAAQLNYSVLPNEEYENINKLLHGGKVSQDNVKSHVLEDLVRQNTIEFRSPSKNHAAWVASNDAPASVSSYTQKHNLVLIPNSLSAFTELANKAGLNLPSKDSSPESTNGQLTEHVRSQSYAHNFSSEELASAAASLGLAVLPVKQLERLQDNIKTIYANDIPTAGEVAELAKKAGLQVIPNNPTMDELQHIVSEDVIVVERETLEALETPGPATLTRLAKRHDMVVLPKVEVDQLRDFKHTDNKLRNTPDADTTQSPSTDTSNFTVDALREAAEKKNMVILSAVDYQNMLKSRSSRDFSHLPMSQRTKFFEELIQSNSTSPSSKSPRQSPASSSLGTMEDRARRMGFVLVTPEEYQQLKQSQLVYEPTKADVIQSAKNYGLATMSLDEYSSLRARKWKSNTQDKERPSSTPSSPRRSLPVEGEEEFKSVPANYLSTLQRIAENPNRTDVTSMASKLGLIILEPEQNDSHAVSRARELGFVEPLSDNKIIAKAKVLGLINPLTDEEIILRAKKLGLIDPLTDKEILQRASELGWIPLPSNDTILAQAKDLGLVNPPEEKDYIKQAERLGFVKPLSNEGVLEKAKELGLVEKPSPDNIMATARNLGLVDPLTNDQMKEQAKSLGLVEPPTDEEIKEKARNLGFTEKLSDDQIVSRAQSMGLAYPLSENEIIEKAASFGMVQKPNKDQIIADAKSIGLVDPLSDEQVKEKAASFGMVQKPNKDQIIADAMSIGLVHPLSDGQVKEKAAGFGMVQKPNKDQIIAEAKSIGLVDPLSDEQVKEKAAGFGMVQKPSRDQIIAEAKSIGLVDPLSDEQVKEKAASFGMVQKPNKDRIIADAMSIGLVHPLSDGQVKEKAASFGMVQKPNKDQIIAEAANFGMVQKPNKDQIIAEAKSIGLVDPMSDEQVKEKASRFGMVQKPNKDQIIAEAMSIGLVHPLNDEQLKEKAASFGMVQKPSKDQIIAEAKSIGLVDPLSDEQIKEKATSFGMVQKPNKDQIIAEAKSIGLVDPMSDEQVKEKASRFGMVQKPSKGQIIAEAKSIGLVDPLSDEQVKEKAASFGMVQKPNKGQIIAEAKSIGLVDPLSDEQVKEKAASFGMVQKPNKDQIIADAMSIGLVHPLSDEQVKEKAASFGMVQKPNKDQIIADAMSIGLVHPLSDEQVKEKAASFGMVQKPNKDQIIADAMSIGLVHPLSDDQVKEKASDLGMVQKPTKEQIVTEAKSIGLIDAMSDEQIREEGKKLGLSEQLSDDELRQKASQLGMVVTPGDEDIKRRGLQLGLTMPMNDAQVKERAKVLGLVGKLSKSELVTEAKSIGLVEPMSNDEIVATAKSFGLVDPPSTENIVLRAKSLGLIDPLNVQEVREGASNLGLFTPLSNEDVLKKAEPLGENQPKVELSNAKNLTEDTNMFSHPGRTQEGFVGPKTSEDDDVDVFLTADQPNESAVAAIGPRRLPHSRRKMNLSETIKSPSAPMEPQVDEQLPNLNPSISSDTERAPSSQQDSNDPSLVKSPSRNKVSSTGLPEVMNTTGTPVRRPVRRYEVRGMKSPIKTGKIPRSTTSSSIQSRISESASNRQHLTHKRTDSVSTSSTNEFSSLPMPRPVGDYAASSRTRTGLSELTFSSMATVSGEDAEKLVSQTIVGEVLYKYYGGLNFEGITGGRHRRYFWFRPETRVLYWNRENPQLIGSPVAKHVTVTGFEEVVDRNPLPVGLYHRTLIIKGSERDLKITCSNQSRHFVWLAALRYTLSTNKDNTH